MDGVQYNGHYDGDEMGERRSIRDSNKNPRKYGSTAKHVTRNEVLVKHLVSKSDTLQGISLKYGVTTEQIRRVNRLWATDSLFLREYLLIPVSKDSPFAAGSSTMTFLSESFDSVNTTSSLSPASSLLDDDDDTSYNEFLIKMDNSIANVKEEIVKTQKSSKFCNEQEEYVQKPKAVARLRHTPSLGANSHSISTDNPHSSSASDIQNFSSTVVMTQGKKVKTSMLRLQKEQDEMFQL